MRARARVIGILGLGLLAAGPGCEGPTAVLDGGSDARLDEDAGASDAGSDAPAPDAGPPPRLFLRDEGGGALVLRGTNVEGASKTAEDHLPRQGYDDFLSLREDLGLNAIRLLVFWQAIEPTRGVYDESYLAAIADVAGQAGDAGLHVVVDMHQDVFGEGFGFTGAPRWACDEALYASFDPPAGNWALGYAEPEVRACFDRLWTDPATRAAFAAAWARLARELRDVPGVFAYELVNEPSAGSATARTFETTLAPVVYAELHDAIRAEDPRPYVFFGPASPSNVGLPTALVPPERDRVIYAPHLYSVALETGGGYDGNAAAIERQLSVIRADAAERALPFVITELGVQPSLPRAADYVRDLFDALDRSAASALQWEIRGGYDLVDDARQPTEVGLALARPFPARTAGDPISFEWRASERSFVLEWDEDAEPPGGGPARGETIVHAPRTSFPAGYDAALDDAGTLFAEETLVRVPRAGGRRRLVLTGR
jgi:endoglycosylceramidase